VFAALVLSALLVCSHGTAPDPSICVNPTKPVHAVVCADRELKVWARAAEALYGDFWRVRPNDAFADRREHPWPERLEACADATCARLEYQFWVGHLLDRGREPYRISGARIFKRSRRDGGRAEMRALDLGDGWTLFVIDAWYSNGVPDSVPFSGAANALVKIIDGQGAYRDGPNGLDFQRRGAGWRVTQVGACECGPHIDLSGVYQR
jgi:hypothetical protein